MSDSKTKKASKTNAKNAKAAGVQQVSLLPQRPAYPPELEGATADVVRVGDQTWVRRDRILNRPDPSVNRYSPQEWEDFKHSIETLGQKSAAHFRTLPEGFWLEDGRHRDLAVGELGWAYVKAEIDGGGNAASSAAWRLHANSQRKADRPVDLALTWQEMMRPVTANPPGAGFTQKQVAEYAKVSAATVSRRMRLVHDNMPFELACLVGPVLDERFLEPLFDVLDDKELVTAGAKAILQALTKKQPVRSCHDVLEVMAQAWADANLAVPSDHEVFGYEVRQDPEFRKAVKSFGAFTVKVPDVFNPGRLHEEEFFRNMEKALTTAQQISDRLQKEAEEAERKAAEKEAKKRVKAAKEGKGKVLEVGTAPTRRPIEERLPERTRRIQHAAMVRFQPAQVSYPEGILVEALARFIDKCGRLHSKADQDAAKAALGIPADVQVSNYGLNVEDVYSDLAPKKQNSRGFDESRAEDGFHALWKKDQAAAMRCVAVALYFDGNQGANSVLGDEASLAELLTGMNRESAQVIARQSLKDQDAGFKPVADGAPCDHCDEQAKLRRKGWNVCRSDVFADLTEMGVRTRRLARMEAAKERAATAKPAAPPEPERTDAPEQPEAETEAVPPTTATTEAEPTPEAAPPASEPTPGEVGAGAAEALPGPVPEAPNSETAATAPVVAPPRKAKGRRGKAAAGA